MRRPLPVALAAALLVPGLIAVPNIARADDGPSIQVSIPITETGVTVTIAPVNAAPVVPTGATSTPAASVHPVEVAPPQDAPAPAPAAPVSSSPAPQAPAPSSSASASPAPVPVEVGPPTASTPSEAIAPSVTSATVSDASTQAPSPAPTPDQPQPTQTVPAQPVPPASGPAAPSTPAPTGAAARDAQFTADGLTSTYSLNPGSSSTPPTGLVVVLDGDGMFGAQHPDSSFVAKAAAEAPARGLATLIPTAPGGQSWWANNAGQANAEWAAALIAKTRADTGTTEKPVWFVTYSGGSQELTKWLLPAHSDALFNAGGGAIITGGGGAPEKTPTLPAGVTLAWVTGSADTGAGGQDGGYNALADAQRGSAAYQGSGATVSLSSPGDLGHADTPTLIPGLLAQRLDQGSVQGNPAVGPTTAPSPAPAPSTSSAMTVPDPGIAPGEPTPGTQTPGQARTPAPTATSPAPVRPAPSDKTSNPSGLPFKLGLFAHDVPGGHRVEQFESVTGVPADILYMAPERQSWDSIINSDWWAKRRADGGRIPDDFTGTLDVAVPLWPENGSLQAAASGGDNAQWTHLGEKVQNTAPGSQIRIGWEFNINWPYAATPENANDWKKAWRNAATAVKQGCPTCKTAWVANLDKSSSLPDPTIVYPGDDVVDLVGVDGYDWDPPYNEQTWPQHRDSEQGWNWWLDFAKKHNKRFTAPEWGVTTAAGSNRGGDNPFYISTMMDWFYENREWIESIIYFQEDADYHRGSLPDQAPNAAKAMTQSVQGILVKSGTASKAVNPAPAISSAPTASTAPTQQPSIEVPVNADPAPDQPKPSETAAPAPAREGWLPAADGHGPVPAAS